jgi:protocatechuate 3,4-dioxygenase beta subunit
MEKLYGGGLFLALVVCLAAGSADSRDRCRPTAPDALGPFYQPGAPVRASVGQGYVLSGTVRAAGTCLPLAGAQIELWLAGPDGKYDDDHRATLFSDQDGGYRFESNFPPRYTFRPPHIHLKVSAPGYRPLITQHYPQSGTTRGTFDLVLEPQR